LAEDRTALLPAFLLTLTINLVDSAVWTMGPVLSESLTPGRAGGAFMIAYMIPPLLSGWFVARLPEDSGKSGSRSSRSWRVRWP